MGLVLFGVVGLLWVVVGWGVVTAFWFIGVGSGGGLLVGLHGVVIGWICWVLLATGFIVVSGRVWVLIGLCWVWLMGLVSCVVGVVFTMTWLVGKLDW